MIKVIIAASYPHLCRKSLFLGSISLSTITIPSSLKVIGDEAFGACYMLEGIKIPGTIRKVRKNVFKDCRKLGEISFASISVGSDVMERMKESTASKIVYEDEE